MNVGYIISECMPHCFKLMHEERKPRNWLKGVNTSTKSLNSSFLFVVDMMIWTKDFMTICLPFKQSTT